MKEKNISKVVVKRTSKDDDSDRFDVFLNALSGADFWRVLETKWKGSGKLKEKFSIVIKPNIMMYYSRRDPYVITDPTLVEFLIDMIHKKGFTKIDVVESQNVIGNWFMNRDVLNVAKAAGYHINSNYKIVDVSAEKVPHKYHGDFGQHWVSPTWRDADFRISFAKNKTHFACYYTLTIKNIYGVSPLQNKFLEYHKRNRVSKITVDMMREFPVDFGIIDGIWSSDGLLGAKSSKPPKHTKTIIAGSDLIAVDWVGAELMGLDPGCSFFMQEAISAFGKSDIERIGDLTRYEDWKNVPKYLDKILKAGENWYGFSNWIGFISTEMDDMFPVKVESNLKKSNCSLFLSVLV